MTHPDVEEFLTALFVVDDAVEQAVAFGLGDAGVAEFVFFTGHHGAAQLLGHGLHAVADAQHRHALLERRLRGPRGLGGGDGFRAAGEDDALGVEFGDVLGGGVEGADFAVDADFAYAASDQLGVLGAEVEDQVRWAWMSCMALSALAPVRAGVLMQRPAGEPASLILGCCRAASAALSRARPAPPGAASPQGPYPTG